MYFSVLFALKRDQRRSNTEQDRTRRARTNALFTFSLTPPQTPGAKYLENVRFSRKVHHDSPIERTKTSNLFRPIELDKFYRMDWFLLQCDAFIFSKTAKYLENVRFSRKLHQDSPIDGSKTSNLYRSVELDEIYRMDWFLLQLLHAGISHKIAKYLQKWSNNKVNDVGRSFFSDR